jgi:hypothetical protein
MTCTKCGVKDSARGYETKTGKCWYCIFPRPTTKEVT